MSFAAQINVEQLTWGYVVVQPHYHELEFCTLLRSLDISEERLGRIFQTYVSCKDSGGFCAVHGTHFPWLIVCFGASREAVLKTFAHEVQHLSESLTAAHGIPHTVETGEVRARVAGDVFDQFYRVYPPPKSSLWGPFLCGALLGESVTVAIAVLKSWGY